VDISALAVDCVRDNAGGMACTACPEPSGHGRDTVAASEKFDLVIANPPLLPGAPADLLEAALWDPGLQATYEFLTSCLDCSSRTAIPTNAHTMINQRLAKDPMLDKIQQGALA